MTLLEIKNLNRRFGGLHAVNNVSFCVQKGTVKGVIGPNGAGKTTLFNLIDGAIKADSGTISLNGKPIHNKPPHVIAQNGIMRTFQNIKLFAHMTCLENVMIGCHVKSKASMTAGFFNFPTTWQEEKKIKKDALEKMELIGISHLADTDAKSLAFGQQRHVEMARALAASPELLLLDEPAAGLNMQETEKLGETICAIKSLGITILLVEHDMSLVMNVSDEINVLCFGQMIAEGKPGEIQKNPEVIRVYLGDDNA